MGWDYRGRRPQRQPGEYSDVTTASTGTNLKAYGAHIVIAATTDKTYTLDKPIAGRAGSEVIIMCTSASTGNLAVVLLEAGCHFGSTASSGASTTLRKATFNAGNEALTLRAASTSKWFIVSNTNSVAIAAT